MDTRRFRRFTEFPCPWPVPIFFGLIWYALTFGWGQTPGDDGSIPPDANVVNRYVDREILFLESGADKGPLIRWWTGQYEREKTLHELKALLDKCEGDLEAELSAQRIERLLGSISKPPSIPEGWDAETIQSDVKGGSFGPTARALYFPQDPALAQMQSELLKSSFFVGSVSILAGVGLIFAIPCLFRNRAGGGPGWRLTGQWSPSLVFTAFFLAEIVGLIAVSGYLGGIIYAFGDPRLGPILATFLGQAASAVIATLILLAASPAIFRVYGLDRPIHWRLVLSVLAALFGIEWLRQTLGVTSSVVDPTDFFYVIDPDGIDLFGDILSGVIVAPIFEEILFRGVLFIGLMRRLGSLPAALISSFLFAIVHLQYNPLELVSIWVFGMACCWLTWKTQSLKPAIVLHMIYNGLITLDVYLLFQRPL